MLFIFVWYWLFLGCENSQYGFAKCSRQKYKSCPQTFLEEEKGVTYELLSLIRYFGVCVCICVYRQKNWNTTRQSIF